MKKIVRQQNYLRELINSQENKAITKQTLRCVLRAVLEPLLDKPEAGVVLYRIINKTGLHKWLLTSIGFIKDTLFRRRNVLQDSNMLRIFV